MKKYTAMIAALLCAALFLTACGGPNPPAGAGEGKPLQIVTTIFPEYDWVREILGSQADNAQVTMLLDSGADLHSYQPSAGDILNISACDLFIYVGGESDEWAADALRETDNQNRRILNLLEALGDQAKAEEIVEGMQQADHEHADEDGHEEELDEHVWLSLKNAQIFCGEIAAALAELDPDHGDSYRANAQAYCEKLSALDERYQAAADAAGQKVLLFGDRFPFRYLADDYGLSYYAAFSGCSAETEASFETVVFLAAKVDELGLNTVCTIEKSDQKIAQTVVQSTRDRDQQIVAMDSMQSVTAQDVSAGASYLSIMEENLDALKEALR